MACRVASAGNGPNAPRIAPGATRRLRTSAARGLVALALIASAEPFVEPAAPPLDAPSTSLDLDDDQRLVRTLALPIDLALAKCPCTEALVDAHWPPPGAEPRTDDEALLAACANACACRPCPPERPRVQP